MSLGFYMDEQVPAAISLGLRSRGVDVLTVQEDDARVERDVVLLERAKELGRILFTQDKDFLAEAARLQRVGQKLTGIVYVKQKRLSIVEIIENLEIIAKAGRFEEFDAKVHWLPI